MKLMLLWYEANATLPSLFPNLTLFLSESLLQKQVLYAMWLPMNVTVVYVTVDDFPTSISCLICSTMFEGHVSAIIAMA